MGPWHWLAITSTPSKPRTPITHIGKMRRRFQFVCFMTITEMSTHITLGRVKRPAYAARRAARDMRRS